MQTYFVQKQESDKDTKHCSNRKHFKNSSFLIIIFLIVALIIVLILSKYGKNNFINDNEVNTNPITSESKDTVEFPQGPFEVNGKYDPNDIFSTAKLSGSLNYLIRSVEIVENIRNKGIDPVEFSPMLEYDGNVTVTLYDNKVLSLTSPYFFDGETGDLLGCSMLLFQIEITNINASFNTSDSSFDYTNMSVFRGDEMFHLIYTCNGTNMEAPLAYIKSTSVSETSNWSSFKIEKGETATLDIGFIVGNRSEDVFSNIGLYVGENIKSDNNNIHWFNMSKVFAKRGAAN